MATVQQIYIAIFGRPADPVGLAYWNEQTNNGEDLSAMIAAFTAAPEYQERFEGRSNEEIISSIYQSLFGREPDAEGLEFYADALASGELPIETIAVRILDGAQNEDRTSIDNKTEAANLFTASLDTPEEINGYVGEDAANEAADFLATVNEDPDSVPTEDEIDEIIEQVNSNAYPEPGEGTPEEAPPPGGGGGGGGGGDDDGDPEPPYANSYGVLESQFEDGELYVGKGNPANNFALSVNAIAGIELGLDVRFTRNPDEVDPDAGTTWNINASDQSDLRFAYSAAAAAGLENYDFRLSIDTDSGPGQTFAVLSLAEDTNVEEDASDVVNNENSQFDWVVPLIGDSKLSVIVDDGGDANGHVTQNIQALQWYTEGDLEAGDEFDVKLQAFEEGSNTVLAETEITIKIDGNTERAVEDFEGQDAGDMVTTAGGYGGMSISDGVATFSQNEEANGGPFTRFDQYRSDNPDVVTTSIDIQLDSDMANGEGFSYSAAANGTDGVHMRDFIFNVVSDGDGIFISASNGTNFDPISPDEGTAADITDGGWYTFQHTMYEEDGVLTVDLEVFDSSGESVFSETLSNAADDFDLFGGNRYGWFTNIDVTGGIEVDNWGLAAQYFDIA